MVIDQLRSDSTANNPLNLEEHNALGAYPHYVKCGMIDQRVSPETFEEGYLQGSEFNLTALQPPLGDLLTVLSP